MGLITASVVNLPATGVQYVSDAVQRQAKTMCQDMKQLVAIDVFP
jgi:hypothetical protein